VTTIGIGTVGEFIEMTQALDVTFCACSTTMGVMGVEELDLIEGCDVAGAAAFSTSRPTQTSGYSCKQATTEGEVRMSDVVYRSEVRIERLGGPIRHAWLPGKDGPVTCGVHGAIAEHYGVSPDADPPGTTTIGYLVAAAGGLPAGTFGGARRRVTSTQVTGPSLAHVDLRAGVGCELGEMPFPVPYPIAVGPAGVGIDQQAGVSM